MTAVALEIDRLSKRFGGLPVTREVSMRVMVGERRLIIGPNGAGKTTLFNQITGDLRPDGGSIRMFGRELVGRRTAQRVAMGMSRTYQILTLFNEDSLLHNEVLSLLGQQTLRWNPLKVLTQQAHLKEL